MKRILRFILMVVFIFYVSLSDAVGQSTGNPADQAGFQFLDRLVGLLVRAVAPGGSSEDLDQDIILLAKELRSALQAKQVDDLFTVRYSRVLSAVRQSALRDPELLYWPMYRFKMVDFIEERTGKMPDWNELLFLVKDHGGSGVGLAMISEAIMSEVVSLHIHLENVNRRPEILKAYMEKSLKNNRPLK